MILFNTFDTQYTGCKFQSLLNITSTLFGRLASILFCRFFGRLASRFFGRLASILLAWSECVCYTRRGGRVECEDSFCRRGRSGLLAKINWSGIRSVLFTRAGVDFVVNAGKL